MEKLNLDDYVSRPPGSAASSEGGFVHVEKLAKDVGVKLPIREPHISLDANEDDEIKQGLKDMIDLYKKQGEDIAALSGKIEEQNAKIEEQNSLKEEMVPMMAEQINKLGDGDEEPDWLKQLKENNAILHGTVMGFAKGLENFGKMYGEFSIAGFDDPDKDKPKEKELLEKFSMLKYVHGCRTEDWRHAGLEKEVAVLMARKRSANEIHPEMINDIVRDVDAGGGYMFPEGVMDMLIDQISPASLPGAVGVQTISDIQRDKKIHYPVLTSRSFGGWVAEKGTIAAGQTTFNRYTLEPSKFAGRILMSGEAMNLITPSQEMVFRQALVDEVAAGISKAFLIGTGAAGQPEGQLINTDIPAGQRIAGTGANGDKYHEKGLQFLKELLKLVIMQNTTGLPSNRWLAHRNMGLEVAWTPIAHYTSQDAEDNPGYVFNTQGITSGTPPPIGGYDWVLNNYVPHDRAKGTESDLTMLAFGPWGRIIQGIWRTMSFMANPYSDAAYTTDQIDFRIIIETGFVNLRPEGFIMRDNIDLDV